MNEKTVDKITCADGKEVFVVTRIIDSRIHISIHDENENGPCLMSGARKVG